MSEEKTQDIVENEELSEAIEKEEIEAGIKEEEKDEKEVSTSLDDEGSEEPTGNEEGLSDDELDAVADTAISVLQEMLKYLSVGEITIDEYEGDEGE